MTLCCFSEKYINDPLFKRLQIGHIPKTQFKIYTGKGKFFKSENPSTGELIGEVPIFIGEERWDRGQTCESSVAFDKWKKVPAPKRGEVVRVIGDELRKHKRSLAELISLETGKIISESEGEVQEAIDICDYAVGLSRSFGGITVSSERADHRLFEQWHPLGSILVVTAFNFPVAVLMWNAAIALACGNTVIWKPSEKTPLITRALTNFIKTAILMSGHPHEIFITMLGDKKLAQDLISHVDFPLISATGSCEMGKWIKDKVGKKTTKLILELGGNNAMIITPNANIDLAVRAAVFSAVGTSGQRCTSLRRLIVHKSIKDKVLKKLTKAYSSIKTGDPLNSKNLMGPLIDEGAVSMMKNLIERIKSNYPAVKIIYGGNTQLSRPGWFVEPTIIDGLFYKSEPVQSETFAPILYVLSYENIDEAIEIQNGVKQGLSSSIFTDNLQEAEYFISVNGSDCGIANINIGTSGAEIGCAFGGEKETGGGRESGSDSWKQYMRRQTCTINYGKELPLAQGVKFDI